jgi:hypothetical protein
MSRITLVNRSGASAYFSLSQAGTPAGQISVGAGAYVVIPTSDTYAISATTMMADGNTYVSAPATFTSMAQDVTAQVLQNGGTFTFGLVTRPGSQLSTITLTNTTKAPVQFRVARGGSPLASVQVLDAFRNGTISTKRAYGFYAVVEGVTTATIETTQNDPAVAVVRDTDALADFPGYSVVFL